MKVMEKRFVKTMDFLQLNVGPFPAATGMMGNVGLVWARIHVKVRKTTYKIPPILYYRIVRMLPVASYSFGYKEISVWLWNFKDGGS